MNENKFYANRRNGNDEGVFGGVEGFAFDVSGGGVFPAVDSGSVCGRDTGSAAVPFLQCGK